MKLIEIKKGEHYIIVDDSETTYSTDITNNEVYYIPLSEVEEAINGYSVEKMAKKYYPHHYTEYDEGRAYKGFINGFKAHQELVKDKLFTLEEARKIYNRGARNGGRAATRVAHGGELNFIPFEDDEAIQSLLPKTEWDIEFDEQGKIRLV